jgi:hypothetical protein
MKIITSSLLVLGLLAVQVSEANAVVCAAGAYHAGCASARGAAVMRRPVGVVGVPRGCREARLWRAPRPRLLTTGRPICEVHNWLGKSGSSSA